MLGGELGLQIFFELGGLRELVEAAPVFFPACGRELFADLLHQRILDGEGATDRESLLVRALGVGLALDVVVEVPEVVKRCSDLGAEGVGILRGESPAYREGFQKGALGLGRVIGFLRKARYKGLLAIEIDYLHPDFGEEDHAVAASVKYLRGLLTQKR